MTEGQTSKGEGNEKPIAGAARNAAHALTRLSEIRTWNHGSLHDGKNDMRRNHLWEWNAGKPNETVLVAGADDEYVCLLRKAWGGGPALKRDEAIALAHSILKHYGR